MLNSHHSENETTVTIVIMEFNMDLLLDSTDWTVTHARAVKSPTVFIKIISQYPRTFFFIRMLYNTKGYMQSRFFFLLPALPHPCWETNVIVSAFKYSHPMWPKRSQKHEAVMWYEKQKADFYVIKRAISLIPWCCFVNDSVTTNTNLPLKKKIKTRTPPQMC